MTDQKLIDEWGRLEVEWRMAFDQASEAQFAMDAKFTKHIIHNLAGPTRADQQELDDLWRIEAEKRSLADAFISHHSVSSIRDA